MEELTLERFCKGISAALEAEGHKDVHSDIKGDIGVVVSDRTEYEITRSEDKSQIRYEVICRKEGRGIDDGVYVYLAGIKSNSFACGLEHLKKVTLGISKKDDDGE